MTVLETLERVRLVLAGKEEAEEGEAVGGLRLDKLVLLRDELPPEYADRLSYAYVRMLVGAERRNGVVDLTVLMWGFAERVIHLVLDYNEDARSDAERERALTDTFESLLPY